MKNIRINRFGQIVIPILVYYLMYHCLHYLFFMAFGEWLGTLGALALSSAVTLVFMTSVYRGLPVVREKETFEKHLLMQECFCIVLTILLGIVLNVMISNTPLVEISRGYREANSALFSGPLAVRILANAILVPMLEEVVYRGIVCGQMQLWYGKKVSVVVSALLFGMMHFNVVQFLYAFLMGLALGYAYIRYQKLWVPAAAHGLTNLVVVLFTAFS